MEDINIQILTCVYIGIVDYFPEEKITARGEAEGSNFPRGEVIHYTNIHTGQYLFYYTESYFIKQCVFLHYNVSCLLCV